ncbi:MAG: prephenate dehydrogenase/arogenate dehydrogenase family protein [Actinomycetota bacterium]
MTSTDPPGRPDAPKLDAAPARIAVLGTGMMGTSIAMAALRAGIAVRGTDADPQVLARASEHGGFVAAPDLPSAVRGAELVVVCTPTAAIPSTVRAVLDAAPEAVVTDAGSVKTAVVREIERDAAGTGAERFVGGHPMGGSERSGPDGAAPSVVDSIVWAITPSEVSAPDAVGRLEAFVGALGSRPVLLSPERHDRLVAIVSHLPQIASTVLMGLAASEEADEPELLLLAAGGFRDLTRLAASSPTLWSDILLSNRDAILAAIDLYLARLSAMRELVAAQRAGEVEEAFAAAKAARLTMAAKPLVRSGVAILQVPIPDRPGALAELTATMAEAGINIEDLQIVHSPEGGRGLVHVTVAASESGSAAEVLGARSFEPTRIA